MQSRRQVLITIATAATSAAAAPLLSEPPGMAHLHGVADQASTPISVDSGPVFFSKEDYAAVSRLSDLIIPRTATPGAIDAGVPHFIDGRVAKNAELQEAFRLGLSELATQSRASGAASFLELSEAQQIALLEAMQSGEFFKAVKNLTIDGYYSSEAGLVRELHYDGNTFRSSFPGCTHPEHWPAGVNAGGQAK